MVPSYSWPGQWLQADLIKHWREQNEDEDSWNGYLMCAHNFTFCSFNQVTTPLYYTKTTIVCILSHHFTASESVIHSNPSQSCVCIPLLAGVVEEFSEIKLKLWWMQMDPEKETITLWHKSSFSFHSQLCFGVLTPGIIHQMGQRARCHLGGWAGGDSREHWLLKALA